MRNLFYIASALIIATLVGLYFVLHPVVVLILAAFFVPLIIMGLLDIFQSRHTIKKNFPVAGRLRYVMETLRPKIYQYFIESDIDGRPYDRVTRSVVYQRAKKTLETSPFGTQLDVYDEGYEWVNHSIAALDHHKKEAGIEHNPRVLIGGKQCKHPYSASLLNISAMSFGSLSTNAVMALNGGAKIGGFAHNTGEGGVSPYHLVHGGDLIFQIGTGYFGARNPANQEPEFSAESFKKSAAHDSVKMIEVKLSQGAKPGHGGILPAKKNTPEIAAIRGVPVGKAVHSPPAHTAFSDPKGLLRFLSELRELSGGKPVGFKLCIGQKSEFVAICKAMVETGLKPDYIAIDGGEGGTGAAPVEFANSVGMPMRDGLAFAYDALVGFDLKKDIVLIASGKIATAFDMYRALAIGADACYAARSFMLSLGCIQSLECNLNICPTGIATQKKHLVKGLVVADKKQRVANFHGQTLHAFIELLAATGLKSAHEINRAHINRNETFTVIRRYDESYPYLEAGCLLKGDIPEEWKQVMKESSADTFKMLV